MSLIVFDIETGPNLDDKKKSAILRKCKAPKNYSDPAKIDAYVRKTFEEKAEKAALSPYLGKIRVISAAHISNRGTVEHVQWGSDDDEKSVLEAYCKWHAHLPAEPKLVGFNISRFDIPFMNVRMLANQVSFRKPFPGHQRDYSRYFDLMTLLEGQKLDEWLRMLGFPGKTADGKDTLNMNIEDTLAYAKVEMESMTLLVQRMQDLLTIRDLL